MHDGPRRTDLGPDPPVDTIDTGSVHREVTEGRALCLSGGGYRAVLFHLGALWRLNELGWLPTFNRVSSVSGGSIVASLLGLKWRALGFDAAGVAARFGTEIVTPLRALASRTIDLPAIALGIPLPGTVNDRLAGLFRARLFGRATLRDLPGDGEGPRIVINASNLQSGALWRFMKPYMRDWRVGEVRRPRLGVAAAVAASSAFPPVLSPAIVRLSPSAFTPRSGSDLQREPYTRTVHLTDGGVYDNLGLETAWKRYRTILVSDAGQRMEPEPRPARDWARQSYRVYELVDEQVRSLRVRQLLASYQRGERLGAYFAIRSGIERFGIDTPLAAPLERTRALASLATRLRALAPDLQERLINWGYAVCDVAMRRHVDPSLDAPAGFPYPASGI